MKRVGLKKTDVKRQNESAYSVQIQVKINHCKVSEYFDGFTFILFKPQTIHRKDSMTVVMQQRLK